MLLTTGNRDVDRAILTVIVTGIIVPFLVRILRPRAKVRYFSPYESLFWVQRNGGWAEMQVASLQLHNIGSEPAKNVVVALKPGPEEFHVIPAAVIVKSEETPDGVHRIILDTLPAKTAVAINMVATGWQARVIGVRSDAGDGEFANVQPQVVLPLWCYAILWTLIVIGIGSIVNWAFILISRVYFSTP